jgi:ParB family transcriptional regulator, chromosome partitioning protein
MRRRRRRPGLSAGHLTLTLARPTVNAALAVAGKEETRARVRAGDLTVDEAVIFAEFDHDPAAVTALERAKGWGHSLEHTAQRLRDDAAERAELEAEIDRLRGEGLPVLDPDEVAHPHRLRLVDPRPRGRGADALVLRCEVRSPAVRRANATPPSRSSASRHG